MNSQLLAVDGGEWSALAPYPWGKDLGTHWTGGWVGPRASLDMAVGRKIP